MSSEWENVKLKDIIDLRVSNVDKKIHPEKQIVKLCNYMDVYRNRYINSEIDYSTGSANQSEFSNFNLKKEDVIITKDSETPEDIGVASVVIEDVENLVCGYHLAILRPKKDLLSGAFLMHLLHLENIQKQFYRVASGSTRYGLTKGAIEEVSLNIPKSKNIQIKIAKILTTVDNQIEKTQSVIRKYEAVKQGMMQDLFTRGIGADGKLRPTREEAPELYQETVLGWVPKEWELKRLDEVCTALSGGTPSRVINEYWTNGTIHWVTPTDITKKKSQLLLTKSKEKITEKGLAGSGAKLLPIGTLLMTSRATIGEILVSDVECCTNQGFKSLIPHQKTDTWFLYYQMKRSKSRYEDFGIGTTFLEINKSDTERFLIVYPTSESERKAIGNRIKNIDEFIILEKKNKEKQEKLKQALMQDLLTGKVSVSTN